MTTTTNTAAAVDYTKTADRARDLLERILKEQPTRKYEDSVQLSYLLATTPVAPRHSADVRVSPNELLRSGLFRVAAYNSEREYLHRECLPLQASRGGYIEYTGIELRQDDCALFLELVRLEQETPGVAIVPLRRTAVALGWGNGNAAVKRVEDSIIRLKACDVEINVNKPAGEHGKVLPVKVGLSLVSAYKSVKKGVWVVYLPQEIRRLCVGNRYTRIVQAYVEKLSKGASLAAWLLRFYSTHREPRALTYEQLQTFCCARSEPKTFKQMVGEALEQLKSIGFLTDFEMGTKAVSVVRNRSPLDELAEIED